MKKKILFGLLFGIMLIGLTGCGSAKSTAKTYLPDEEIKYGDIKVVFKSEYKITKGCALDSSNYCYEVQIPFEIINTSNKTYNVGENGPFFDVYDPSGVFVSISNNGYLETWGGVRLKPNATIKDIMQFDVKKSGEYTLESKDGNIEILYNIVIPN